MAYQLEQDLRAASRLANDQQMAKDADLMRKYQDTLAKWVQQQTGRPPRASEAPVLEGPARGRQPLPASEVPTVEIK